MLEDHPKMKARPEFKRLVCLAIVLAMLVAVAACKRTAEGEQDAYASAVTVTRGTVATVVQMAGQVVALNSLELEFGTMSGRLVDVAVQTGQEVQAGQELMRLDATTLERTRREAEADLKAAEAALVAAQKGAGASELVRAEADLAYASYQEHAATLELDIVEKRGVDRLRDAVADAEVALRVARDELRLKEIGEGQATIRALEYDVAFFQRVLRDLPPGDPQRAEAQKNLVDGEDALARARQAREDALSAVREVVDDKAYELAQAKDNLARALSGATDPANSARLAQRAALEAQAAAQRKVDVLRAGGESDAVEAARTAYEAALAAVESAAAAVEAATLRAPFDGTAMAVYVSANDTMGPGQKVMFLADLSALRLDAQVTELDVPKIELGQAVRVTFDVYPGQLFSGEVLELPQQSTSQSGIAYYRVITSLDSGDVQVRLGMYANARVVIGERYGVLTMPAAAIRYDEMAKTYVSLRRADGTIVAQPVEVGMNDGIVAEVLSGLSEGDTVMVPLVPATDPYGPKPIILY
jgi:HlyD family secretion protein